MLNFFADQLRPIWKDLLFCSRKSTELIECKKQPLSCYPDKLKFIFATFKGCHNIPQCEFKLQFHRTTELTFDSLQNCFTFLNESFDSLVRPFELSLMFVNVLAKIRAIQNTVLEF